MSKKLILFFSIAVISISCVAQNNSEEVNFKDSISTVQYLKTMNICEKINFAEKNIRDIIKWNDFKNLVLNSISKDSKTKILIQSINGNMVVPDERVIQDLKEQLNSIKVKKGCNL